MTKKEIKERQNKKIHVGMVSSYLQLIEDKGYGEVFEIQNKHKVVHTFLIPPVDIDTGDIYGKDVESMLEHFIEQEDYRKCAKIKEFQDNNKVDCDGWYYLPNKIENDLQTKYDY